MIWPSSHNAGVISTAGGLDAAVAELRVCNSTKPTPADWDNINIALASGSARAARVVAELSERWRDKQLWFRAFKTGKGDSNVNAFGVDRVAQRDPPYSNRSTYSRLEYSTQATTTMGYPDEDVYPTATGRALETVKQHESPQDLVFWAGWVRGTSYA